MVMHSKRHGLEVITHLQRLPLPLRPALRALAGVRGVGVLVVLLVCVDIRGRTVIRHYYVFLLMGFSI